MGDSVLVLNAGSSSVKFSTYGLGPSGALQRSLRGELEAIGTRPRLAATDVEGRSVVDTSFPVADVSSRAQAIQTLSDFLRGQHETDVSAVGHRVVHGGPHHAAPAEVTPALLQELEALVPWAPLHQPACLEGIRAMAALDKGVRQVACFDTSFHHRMPELARRFALPDALYREGVLRYGFHGLSYESISTELAEASPRLARGRVVVAHLGNGASMCALRAGQSVDTTMGFSVLDGLPMGTRCGAMDPGVLLYLLGPRGMSLSDVNQLLYEGAGLKGLSGESSDMRDLLSSKAPPARLAVEYFGYRVARELGGLAAVLGGLDGLVFTGGIGEHAAAVRADVLGRSRWLGLLLDAEANARNAPCISTAASAVQALVVPTDEELVIARHTVRVLGLANASP
ncbi:MAG: acetate/propionate family kinase [Myxococcaceae bacterium]